ncbi:DUF1599 domain-containing protein [Blattabacterium cuenoti]|uniref:DUF1599 domain-containing protein n=1 Tax=Blattabacterium cuenoti TaxID=1653831 RepID=UPI00163C41A2|nr:DUF1599 domain-containing protein [Blattabacterium cuenoti]
MNHIVVGFIIKKCKKLFQEKLKDYDLSWKIIKISSMIDQIFIKIVRIQNLQKKGNQKVKEENIVDTYLDVINYIIITLIKLNFTSFLEKRNISHYEIFNIYTKELNKIKNFNEKEVNDNDEVSIDTIIENILSCKKKKNFFSQNLEKFYLKMLKMITFLLVKKIDKIN